jgi:hypothetical protein
VRERGREGERERGREQAAAPREHSLRLCHVWMAGALRGAEAEGWAGTRLVWRTGKSGVCVRGAHAV